MTARSALAALLLLPLATACTPAESVTPPPASTAPAEPATPTPTASPTPTQQELSAQAENAYKTGSEEMRRLLAIGGQTEASPAMRSVTAELALAKYRVLLKDQKERGYTVSGSGKTVTKPTPGTTSKDYDPRLTLQVCEDWSGMTWTEAGETLAGDRTQGWAYGRLIDGKVKIVNIVTDRVDRCELS